MATPTANPGEDRSLRKRLFLLAVLLTVECLALAEIRHPWFSLQQPAAAPIVFLACLAFAGKRRIRAAHLAAGPVSHLFATLHAAAFLLTVATGLALLRFPGLATGQARAIILLWSASLLLLGPSLILTFFAPRRVARALVALGPAWLYAAVATILVMSGRTLARLAWDAPNSTFGRALASATFRGVRFLLTLFYPNVVVGQTGNILGTPDFLVEVAGVCSGMEGLALILVLTTGWLVYARKELRLARAIWLVPLALILMGLLNIARIAALIAIGASGHPAIAVTGFHAEAGWILFNLVAFAFLLAVQRMSSLRKAQLQPQPQPQLQTNPAAIYLLPFLAILATSLVTHAASSGFEWLYPLRFLAAVIVVWFFRASYRRMDWHFTWLGPAAGVLVFALWLAFAHASSQTGTALASGLAALTPAQRLIWLTFRVLAAVLTVPLAEELAFRGYLARRIMQPDFEAVPFRSLSLPAILVSATVFALMHGRMAAAGFMAGLVFTLAARRRNRLGEAVAAHVTANLLLALWVLLRGDYALW